ncbi:hypothetical protein BTH42_21635 [Burkholderia sp. SRS-W-2-2016]|uniref:hypothetical protein n=1 Tax=Burkholderia sp. SRS-W-2-2016 TaxID=1926878 RepID=UPI00094AF3D2|nr:hypothetical protein [Burkholderia sp. SRS-W-2-2016]OLL29564.1 hypothetical protein BTH42_21635 [Burkholderia sp. SRS-W-2-2016]
MSVLMMCWPKVPIRCAGSRRLKRWGRRAELSLTCHRLAVAVALRVRADKTAGRPSSRSGERRFWRRALKRELIFAALA